jgi:hypothetical protein
VNACGTGLRREPMASRPNAERLALCRRDPRHVVIHAGGEGGVKECEIALHALGEVRQEAVEGYRDSSARFLFPKREPPFAIYVAGAKAQGVGNPRTCPEQQLEGQPLRGANVPVPTGNPRSQLRTKAGARLRPRQVPCARLPPGR